MQFVITIVVQALLLGSWVNAQFQEGPYLEPSNENYSYTCPKLYEGVCDPSRHLHLYGYYDTCDLCYNGCTHYFDGRYNCRECKPGRWGPWCQYSCIPCSECTYGTCQDLCIERNNTTACVNSECPDRCSIGFYGNRKSEQDDCTIFCGDCRDKQCHKCKIGWYLYVKNGKQICIVCPTGSISCRLDTFHNNAIQAISCNTGYYLRKQDGLIRCITCPNGCPSCRLDTFHNNTIQAISCDTGYYLHKKDGLTRCIRCPNKCKSCRLDTFNNNTVQCTRCVQKHYLDSRRQDGMIGCSECPLGYEKCKLNTFYNNTIQCIRSEIGFYLNASNQDQMVECSKCPDHCISCKLETIHSKTTINCTSCLKRYYLYTPQQETGQRCVECPVPCETCIFNTYIYLMNYEPICTSCAQGYYFNYKNDHFNKCTQCPNGCWTCGLLDFNAKIPNCTKCEDGFSFQIKDGMGECVINSCRLDVSAEVIVTFLSIVTVFIVAIGVACFIKRRDKRLIWNVPVAEETKGRERSIGRSKDDGEWLPLGEKMYFNPKIVIGNGSNTVVYEGRFGQAKIKKIAVKAIRCTDHEEAEEYNSEIHKIYRENREMKMIVTLIDPYRHPNIVDFIDSFIDNDRLYIAFELGKGTLADYVSHALWRETLKCSDVNRGISEGLGYVHEKGIVHRDLKPANVFIVARCDNLKAVIGDFGTAKPTAAGSMFSLTGQMGSVGYIAPEIWTALSQNASERLVSRGNKKSDIFSAAILFYYTLSLGDHPFGNEMTAQDSIQKGSTPVYMNNKFQLARNSYTHQALIECMLKPNPEERLTAAEVCSHPANWTEQQIMDYFKDKSDEFENQITLDPLRAAILENPGLIPTGNWMKNLPLNTRTYLKNYKANTRSSNLYKGKQSNVRALLRAIRNTNSHHAEYPPDAQQELGDYPGGHLDMWLRVCPRLLMHVFTILGPP